MSGKPGGRNKQNEMDDDFNSEDFDKILAKIQEESLRHYNEVELPRAAALKEQEQKKNLDVSEGDIFKSKVTTKDGNTSFGDSSQPMFHHGDDAEGFHYAAGKTYIYPSNYPVRKYQADIVPTALFHNTLVSLPTGLGKTFIAAVVMYNFYRWYPMGKVIFMAPTRPLVTQQLSACRDIMGIPIEDTVELTGTTQSGDRNQLWNTKRVFYLTPQVLMNDLRNNLLQASSIKCLVIDEAHRATKGYAYCQVVKILFEENVKFRILALSATPGTDANAVKDVIANLHIEKLEIRSEDSADVVEYSHTKSVIPIIVDLPAFLRDIWNQYMEVYENYVRKIRELKVLNQNVATMSKFQMLTAFRKFTSRPPSTLPKNVVQSINGDFTSCITLAHGRELLQTYGLRTFHSYFTDAENSSDKAASITRLSHDTSFRKLLGSIEEIIFKEDNGDSRQYNWSHPKMEHLVSVVNEHFEMKAKAGETTKAIIFCQYRLVVTEVYEIMKKFVPLAKPVMFIGQGSKEKGQGLPQKKQIEYNVLIATSVAEEGLDIGDVDLIVSMETHRSPIKLVQRFGRTGRKRSGRCVVLLTSGSEVKKFNEVMSTQKNYSSIISAPGVRASLEENSPRMVPLICKPRLQLLHIKVPKTDKRKQCDIRNVFGRLDTSRTHAPAAASSAPVVPASAFLTDAELAQVREELGSYFPNFHRLPPSSELWPRQKGPRLEIDEFASDKFSGYSDWLDWSEDFQETHVVGHSRDSKILVELLQKAAEIRERTDGSDEPVHDLIPSPPSSLWSTVGPNQKKKNEIAKKTKMNGKNPAKSKHGLDIRECMAKVPPKVSGFISQDSTMDDVYSAFNRKNTTSYKNRQNMSAIEEGNDVIIINDDLDQILDDILIDFASVLGKPSYCSLSKNNRDIRSVALKCFSSSVKCEVNFDIVPNICDLLQGVTIDDVKNFDLNELPCMKSTTLKNGAVFGKENVEFNRLCGRSLNKQVDFVNINRESVRAVDGLVSSSFSKQVHFENVYETCVGEVDRLDSSSLNKQVDFVDAKKESTIDVEDEDTCMSTDSFIVGLDEIMKFNNVKTEDVLKDATNTNTHKNEVEYEEDEWSPILSQRPVKSKKVKTEKVNDFSNLFQKEEEKVGGFDVDENELSPILSQRPPNKKSKGNSFNNVTKRSVRMDEELEMNYSPILSQRQHKKKSNAFNIVTKNSSCKNERSECSGFEERNFSPDLSQKPRKPTKGSEETFKRKLNVDSIAQKPKFPKNADESFEKHFDDNQAFDTAFMDEFDEDMLAQLSPILSQTFKKPKVMRESRNVVDEHELSPILSQSRKKSSNKSVVNVGESGRIPNLSSSTPKCVKKDLFQNLSKFDRLSPVKEVDMCRTGNRFEENKRDDENEEEEDFEELVGLDEILALSKCNEEKRSTISIDPTPSHSPKRLSYYMKGNSLYTVTQLVEKAIELETDRNKQNTIDVEEEKQKADEFVLNSSDDDLFNCADSKIDLNFEEETSAGSVKHENVSVNKSNQSVNYSKQTVNMFNQSENKFDQSVNDSKTSIVEVSDSSKSASTKLITGNENNLEKSQEVLDDDEDYFEITGLDELLMRNCLENKSSNLKNSKSAQIDSKPPTSVQLTKTSELKIDSEDDEFLIESCLDDIFINSSENIENNDLKPTVQGKGGSSNKLESESDSSTSKYFNRGLIDGSKSQTDGSSFKNFINKVTSKSDGLTSKNISNKVDGKSKFETDGLISKHFTNKVGDKSKFETENQLSTRKEIDKQVTDSIKPKCSTQFKSDYLSNEELEELLKSGMFSDSPMDVADSKTEKSAVEVLDLTGNDSEIIDNSSEFYVESPILLSYGNRSDKVGRSLCSNKNKSVKGGSKFSLLSKSKSKGGLNSGKETQSKLTFASTSKKEDCGGCSNNKKLSKEETKLISVESWASPVVKLTKLENMKTKDNSSDEIFSWGSSTTERTRKENVKNKSVEGVSCGSPVVKSTKLKNIETNVDTVLDETFSWGSPAAKSKVDRSKESWQFPDLKETRHFSKESDKTKVKDSDLSGRSKEENANPNLKTSGGGFCLGSSNDVKDSRREKIKPNERICLIDGEDMKTKPKSLEDSFSWETRDMRGYEEQDHVDKSNREQKQLDKSVIVIDDDSFTKGVTHCKRGKPKIISSETSSTDMEEDGFPSIHTSVLKKVDNEVGKICKPSTSIQSRKSVSFKASKSSDTDGSSDIFILSPNKKSDRSLNDSVPSKRQGAKSKKSKKNKKANAFIESEADVSGDETSSGRETSGLDSLDESFVDDKVNDDNTMMVAHYLQTVKTPKKIAGGYRIPELSESVMAREVYSQYVPMEHETYVNDSFCVKDDSESKESEMSELEIAEKLLARRKKIRKRTKRKRKSSSESVTDLLVGSSQESVRSVGNGGKEKKTKKKRRIVILDDSSE
ncbi:hypothetical protein LSTR_LSTR013919 [Laodelphax striatellus]|uniref:Fanconi anemia group M protein n=1 Tax=Laodelphax striatellus TaxID=195883 RepID=A0A482X3T0_LAOST|nr:hypothetical protein LSTR_LSTR013919 [Laodelphax striatellus]